MSRICINPFTPLHLANLNYDAYHCNRCKNVCKECYFGYRRNYSAYGLCQIIYAMILKCDLCLNYYCDDNDGIFGQFPYKTALSKETIKNVLETEDNINFKLKQCNKKVCAPCRFRIFIKNIDDLFDIRYKKVEEDIKGWCS